MLTPMPPPIVFFLPMYCAVRPAVRGSGTSPELMAVLVVPDHSFFPATIFCPTSVPRTMGSPAALCDPVLDICVRWWRTNASRLMWSGADLEFSACCAIEAACLAWPLACLPFTPLAWFTAERTGSERRPRAALVPAGRRWRGTWSGWYLSYLCSLSRWPLTPARLSLWADSTWFLHRAILCGSLSSLFTYLWYPALLGLWPSLMCR
mmetsp:Transcript_51032/g.163285  ORF Transcript_51032/g.163285 Transcript_51032/m.163285 type:complete len:207 (+) Transcript_51032:74-694(+)